MDELQKGEVLIYQSENGDTNIDVYFEDRTVWLSQSLIAELYQTTPQNIIMHTKNIYKDNELGESTTCKQSLQVQVEGNRSVKRSVKFYNLDMILAIGYRVRSHVGMQFRNWATSVLTEYMKKGFALNDARLKNPKPFGDDYFGELLARIRDIRASEKRFYMKVRDIYALSIDYNPKLKMTREFFTSVQNKLHYAVHGMTAAELIVSRVDSGKTNMGLTTYLGEHVLPSDVTVAKNYLERSELEGLNRIVTMFLDHAEDMARQKIPMYMKNWVATLDEFLGFRKRKEISCREAERYPTLKWSAAPLQNTPSTTHAG